MQITHSQSRLTGESGFHKHEFWFDSFVFGVYVFSVNNEELRLFSSSRSNFNVYFSFVSPYFFGIYASFLSESIRTSQQLGINYNFFSALGVYVSDGCIGSMLQTVSTRCCFLDGFKMVRGVKFFLFLPEITFICPDYNYCSIKYALSRIGFLT